MATPIPTTLHVSWPATGLDYRNAFPSRGEAVMAQANIRRLARRRGLDVSTVLS